MKQRKITEAGVTNPGKLSLKVRDLNHDFTEVHYEESPPTNGHARHTSEVTTPVNKIVSQKTTDIITITGR